MDRNTLSRSAPWTASLVAAALCLAPTSAHAVDSVKKLKDAVAQQDFMLIEGAIPELKSINELRRAYFLTDWGFHKEFEVDPKLDAMRKKIGERLTQVVQGVADRAIQDKSIDRQIAVARTIAEMAESDKPSDRAPTGKFAARFVPILTKLAKHDELLVRQCAIDALGKATPKPADVLPIFVSALKGSELGPRRLAAYGLIDLVKNANYLDRADEMDMVAGAIDAAALAAKSDDELIRAYGLQTIHWAAKAFSDYPRSGDSIFPLDKEAPKADVRKIFRALHNANPAIVSGLQESGGVDIRLTALEALAQVVGGRIKIIEKLAEGNDKLPADKRPIRGGLFEKGEDPLGTFLEADWEIVPGLLKKEEDVRLRRAAMSLLESVAEDIDLTIGWQKMDKLKTAFVRQKFHDAIRTGLIDTDRVVRWSAARTVRFVTPELVDDRIVEGLGHMLTDRTDRDYDLSASAAASLEAIAASPAAPKALRFLKSAIIDREKDAEIREASLRTLGQLGAPGNLAFPEVTSVLTDPDVRIRRLATETLGVLGRPTTREHFDEAIAALKIALRDEDAQVRQNTAEAILNIAAPWQPGMPKER